MAPRALAWLLALPLMTAGSLLAHGTAYVAAEPDERARVSLLAQTGHAYFSAVPFLVGMLLALLFAGVAATVWRARRGRRSEVAGVGVALLPLLCFVVQEQLERTLAGGFSPLETVSETPFLVGLALQLPFALVALAAARWLGRVADERGQALATDPPRRLSLYEPPALSGLLAKPRPLLLAAGASGRGPPCSR
jgi:hypothetical protein